MMNSVNNAAFRPQMTIQQSSQAEQTKGTEATDKAGTTQATGGPSGMIKQDTSDVARMGTSAKLRIKDGKEKEKENLGKIRKDMGPEKLEKAEQAETKFLGNFAKRKRSSIENEDKDYARREVEDLLKDLEGDFSNAEAASILQSLKDNVVVAKDVILKDAIEDQITALIQRDLSTQMEVASAGIMPKDGIMTGSEKRDVLEDVVLGYSTQEQFLDQMEQKVGAEKMNTNFSAVLSHTMADLSASMSALAMAGGGEKGAVYAAASGISSLQQMTGVHVEAGKMLNRMSESYPRRNSI